MGPMLPVSHNNATEIYYQATLFNIFTPYGGDTILAVNAGVPMADNYGLTTFIQLSTTKNGEELYFGQIFDQIIYMDLFRGFYCH